MNAQTEAARRQLLAGERADPYCKFVIIERCVEQTDTVRRLVAILFGNFGTHGYCARDAMHDGDTFIGGGTYGSRAVWGGSSCVDAFGYIHPSDPDKAERLLQELMQSIQALHP